MRFISPIIELIAWFIAKVFEILTARLYTTKIIYNQLWEDPRCDAVALELKPEDVVLEITSAGDHALENAAAGVKHVYAIDRNPCQTALLELKIVAIKHLDYATFWDMFGAGRRDNFRKEVYPILRPHLSPEGQKFWDSTGYYFEGGFFRPTFYWHSLAGVFGWLSVVYFKLIPGLHKSVSELFDAKTVDEQKRIYFGRIQRRMWNPILKKLLESSASLSWMGVPMAQQDLLSADENIGMFMKKSLEFVMTEIPLHENYHWRVYFRGCYAKDCCPEYLKEDVFNRLKSGLVDNISLHTCTVTEFLKEHKEKDISKFILLDHMDWMAKHPESLAEEWQEIMDHSTPDARYLWRSAAKETGFVNDTPITVSGKKTTVGQVLKFNRKLAEKLHMEDRVHTYSSFHIGDLNTAHL
jgi:S-adenosylmethionine-diacylglycerol 3-amino-3-carboxypropyl transferase